MQDTYARDLDLIVVGLLLLFFIGIAILRKLDHLSSMIKEIRENLPGRHFLAEDGIPDAHAFWKEAGFTMARIARIYEKVYLRMDHDVTPLRERILKRRGVNPGESIPPTSEP